MPNFEYNLSPTSLRSPSRLSHSTNSRDRSRRSHSNMTVHNSSSRRQPPQSSRQSPLTLSNLPRFHPANFANYVHSTTSSNSSSTTTSPESDLNSPQEPVSPRSARSTAQLSEAQRQLYLYHRELFNLNRSGSGASSPSGSGFTNSRPVSPNLQPLASPGAVTPLELEQSGQADNYLVAGIQTAHAPPMADSNDEVIDTYIRREARSNDVDMSLAQ